MKFANFELKSVSQSVALVTLVSTALITACEDVNPTTSNLGSSPVAQAPSLSSGLSASEDGIISLFFDGNTTTFTPVDLQIAFAVANGITTTQEIIEFVAAYFGTLLTAAQVETLGDPLLLLDFNGDGVNGGPADLQIAFALARGIPVAEIPVFVAATFGGANVTPLLNHFP